MEMAATREIRRHLPISFLLLSLNYYLSICTGHRWPLCVCARTQMEKPTSISETSKRFLIILIEMQQNAHIDKCKALATCTNAIVMSKNGNVELGKSKVFLMALISEKAKNGKKLNFSLKSLFHSVHRMPLHDFVSSPQCRILLLLHLLAALCRKEKVRKKNSTSASQWVRKTHKNKNPIVLKRNDGSQFVGDVDALRTYVQQTDVEHKSIE